MSDRRSLRRSRPTVLLLVALGASILLVLPLLASLAGAAYPVLPDSEWSPILSHLAGPTLTPGGSGGIAFRLGNPLPYDLIFPNVSLQVYAFNPTDGGGPFPPPAGSSPILAGGGLGANKTGPTLPPGTSWNWSVPVAIPSTASTGDYAVRFSVTFFMNNVSYRLESRGFFSSSAWANATEESNGTPTINASRLGVSGVVPETSILVSPPGIPIVLYSVLGVGLVLAGVGAYWWTRSEAKSRSGTRRSSPPQSAPTAFGSNRSKEGD